MLNRHLIPIEIVKEVLIESSHRCAICGLGCPLERAYIIPLNKLRVSKTEDFLCVCAVCHSRIVREKWGEQELREYKETPWILRNFDAPVEQNPKTISEITIDLQDEVVDHRTLRFIQSAIAAFLKVAPKAVPADAVANHSKKVKISLSENDKRKLLFAYQANDEDLTKYLAPLLVLSIGESEDGLQKGASLRCLSEEELESFREDYRELEREIQSFFRVYYITGLIAVVAWIVGPQSRPLLELAIGNGGFNIYAPLGIATLNMVATALLLYKSISIHEIAQFMTVLSKPDSAFIYWENWRRSSQSVTKVPRIVNALFISLVPLALSGLILGGVYLVIFSTPNELANKIEKLQPPLPPTAVEALAPSSGVGNTTNVDPLLEAERIAEAKQKALDQRIAYIETIFPVLRIARGWWAGVIAIHLIPLWFIYVSTLSTKKSWTRILKERDAPQLFSPNDAKNLACSEEIGNRQTR